MIFDQSANKANITLMGVGGAGSNIVNRLYLDGASDINFVIANTDKQALEGCKVPNKIQLGTNITGGQGCGAKPWVGENAAKESVDEIVNAVKDTNILFVISGMGGGTGTGAAPIIAAIAKELGVMVISIVTKPFNFEGKKRGDYANIGIRHLETCSDSLVVLKNNELLNMSNKETSVTGAFSIIDDFLKASIRGVINLMFEYGIINVDFEDVKTVIKDKGRAFLSVGTGGGENKIDDAIDIALNNPLLETKLTNARSVLLNVEGGENLSIADVQKVSQRVTDEIHPDANVIFGATVNKEKEDLATVTILATGFFDEPAKIKVVTDYIEDGPYEMAGPLIGDIEIEAKKCIAPVSLMTTSERNTATEEPVKEIIEENDSVILNIQNDSIFNNLELNNQLVKDEEEESKETEIDEETEESKNSDDESTESAEEPTKEASDIGNEVNNDASIVEISEENDENISTAEENEAEIDLDLNLNIEDSYVDESNTDNEDNRLQEYFNLEDNQGEQRISRINRHENEGLDENKQGFFKMFSPK